MIAPHKGGSDSAGAIRHFVRTCSVANDVAEVDHEIEGRSVGQARIESLKIRVYVAQQKYAHEAPDKLPIIAHRAH
jgi:hypothetical protein